MRIELTEICWLREHHALSVNQLAELSDLSATEINELVDYGAITPIDPDVVELTFDTPCLVVAKTARRLRDDFDLDTQGVALALALLDRVRQLEAQVQELRARLPRRIV